MTMALLSSPSAPSRLPTLSPSPSSSKPHFPSHKPYLHLPSKSKRTYLSILLTKAITDNGAGIATSSTASVVADEKVVESSSTDKSSAPQLEKTDEVSGNPAVKKFEDPGWVNGIWDLNQFRTDGKTDWDAVIDAALHDESLFGFINAYNTPGSLLAVAMYGKKDEGREELLNWGLGYALLVGYDDDVLFDM